MSLKTLLLLALTFSISAIGGIVFSNVHNVILYVVFVVAIAISSFFFTREWMMDYAENSSHSENNSN